MERCKYCGNEVEFVKDDNGNMYCPDCGFYKDEEETVSE